MGAFHDDRDPREHEELSFDARVERLREQRLLANETLLTCPRCHEQFPVATFIAQKRGELLCEMCDRDRWCDERDYGKKGGAA